MTYDEFINNIINTRGRFIRDNSIYKERHHILPKCMGGSNLEDNLIDLSAKEHFIAHYMLANENPNNYKLGLALNSMLTFNKCKDNMSLEELSEMYEEARILASKAISKAVSGSNNGMYGKSSWNKGLTKETDERIRLLGEKTSKSKLGVKTGPFTEEHKAHMREAAKLRDYSNYISPNRGKVAITDGKITKFVDKDYILPKDFYYGNCNASGEHNMSNYWSDFEAQKRNSLAKSGERNSSYGHGERVSGGKNGKAIYDYYFDGKYFECRKYLIEYLDSIGLHTSESTLRAIQNGDYGKCIEKKYKYIIDNLRWSLKDENKISN